LTEFKSPAEVYRETVTASAAGNTYTGGRWLAASEKGRVDDEERSGN